jgi:hypothetical protein
VVDRGEEAFMRAGALGRAGETAFSGICSISAQRRQRLAAPSSTPISLIDGIRINSGSGFIRLTVSPLQFLAYRFGLPGHRRQRKTRSPKPPQC